MGLLLTRRRTILSPVSQKCGDTLLLSVTMPCVFCLPCPLSDEMRSVRGRWLMLDIGRCRGSGDWGRTAATGKTMMGLGTVTTMGCGALSSEKQLPSHPTAVSLDKHVENSMLSMLCQESDIYSQMPTRSFHDSRWARTLTFLGFRASSPCTS